MTVSSRLLSSGRELDLGANAFGEVTRSGEFLGQPEVLRKRLEADGYLCIPGFFDRDLIRAVQKQMLFAKALGLVVSKATVKKVTTNA